MRFFPLVASALLLAGCGGEEYPVPASEAFATLDSVGMPKGLYPLPVGLEDVNIDFQSVPDASAVQWKFSHGGDDLATIVARVDPAGEAASKVSVYYAEGSAPDENWRNGKVRGLLKREVQQLVVEAVDSKFEKRPFDTALRARVSAATAAASMGALMQDVVASRDAEIERRKQRDFADGAQVSGNPAEATEPMTDLSKYN